ncbi:hypothetical protein B0T16DRAFT_388853 [Cercophora newfieldiana]|uniref:Uncharacterized protein n=1 Tax=Cercophora newfieldiana TaxID=92897 RepID=A0AA40CRF8_9PEZI|nr:hypothetical protein B0T16DRAFT_388853 [Cercophora newfieldiana]
MQGDLDAIVEVVFCLYRMDQIVRRMRGSLGDVAGALGEGGEFAGVIEGMRREVEGLTAGEGEDWKSGEEEARRETLEGLAGRMEAAVQPAVDGMLVLVGHFIAIREMIRRDIKRAAGEVGEQPVVCLEMLHGVVVEVLEGVSEQVLAQMRVVVRDRDDLWGPCGDGRFDVARLKGAGDVATMAKQLNLLDFRRGAVAARYVAWEAGIKKVRDASRIMQAVHFEGSIPSCQGGELEDELVSMDERDTVEECPAPDSRKRDEKGRYPKNMSTRDDS